MKRLRVLDQRATTAADPSAQAVSLAGPGSALLSYLVVGFFCYGVVIALYVPSIQFLIATADPDFDVDFDLEFEPWL